jgi:hypothetical protein
MRAGKGSGVPTPGKEAGAIAMDETRGPGRSGDRSARRQNGQSGTDLGKPIAPASPPVPAMPRSDWHENINSAAMPALAGPGMKSRAQMASTAKASSKGREAGARSSRNTPTLIDDTGLTTAPLRRSTRQVNRATRSAPGWQHRHRDL